MERCRLQSVSSSIIPMLVTVVFFLTLLLLLLLPPDGTSWRPRGTAGSCTRSQDDDDDDDHAVPAAAWSSTFRPLLGKLSRCRALPCPGPVCTASPPSRAHIAQMKSWVRDDVQAWTGAASTPQARRQHTASPRHATPRHARPRQACQRTRLESHRIAAAPRRAQRARTLQYSLLYISHAVSRRFAPKPACPVGHPHWKAREGRSKGQGRAGKGREGKGRGARGE